MNQPALDGRHGTVARQPSSGTSTIRARRSRAHHSNDFDPPMPSQVACVRAEGRAQPQRLLMLAVLRTALEDCALRADDGSHLGRRPDARARHHAVAFIFSDDRSWPFSFENICDTIGIDAQRLRRRVSSLAPHLDART